MLKTLKPRLYQETIFAKTTGKDTLVVLPTGLGKTALAMMLAEHRLDNYKDSKILIIAPTKPLVEQHCTSFRQQFDADRKEFVIFTGEMPPAKRELLWKDAKFIFSTPQGLENDIIASRIKLEEISLLVFDEAHRAVGDYAYNFIAREYVKRSKHPRILGLTASPGSNMEKIEEVCRNLHIEHIEVRTEQDSDVKQYVHDIQVDWVKVDLPPAFLFIKKTIDALYNARLHEIKNLGYLNTTYVKKTDLLALQAQLHGMISENNPDIFKAISLVAEVTKIQHAVELLETQGIHSLYAYISKLQDEAGKGSSKAVKNIVADEKFTTIFEMTKKLYENNVEHPKILELKKIVFANKSQKMIIFSHYRDTGAKIKKELDAMGVKSNIFVGQAKKGESGLSQKQQKQVLQDFRDDVFTVLIATSVAEEGLDVPNVNLVVFYEPLPSSIRTIQRRGRTGRHDSGKVIILMANKTRDEAYHWSTQHKEKSMHRLLTAMKNKVTLKEVQTEIPLTKYDDVKIICDDREKHNGVVKQLVELGVKVDLKRLDVGDYVVSERCIIELKTIPDFVDSIIDGRLLEQLKTMVSVERPVLILEGIDDIYSQRNLHPNAIRGMLSTIAVSYGIPMIQTKNNRETAELLYIIGKREQDLSSKSFNQHGSKKPLSDKEIQEYIVSSLPNVGPAMAKELLHKFRSVRKIFNASEDELKQINGVGDKTVNEIQRTLDKDYYV